MAEAKTQAVQAAVGVLLTATAVTGATGVFEVQEHHSAVGWFTSCAACLIVATLIPLATFALFPWIEHLGTKNDRKSIGGSMRTIAAEGEKIVISASPRFLMDSRRNYKTKIEADAAMARYGGKWIDIEGKIDDISFLGSQKEKLSVTIVPDRRKPLEIVFLYFNNQEFIKRLTVLSHGDPIKARGKIESITSYHIGLEDCELID